MAMNQVDVSTTTSSASSTGPLTGGGGQSAHLKDCKTPNRLTLMLDEIEKRIESLRGLAEHMNDEQQCLLQSLHTLQKNESLRELSKCEREEIEVNADRLVCRCLTVEVAVIIPRSEAQEDALKETKKYLDSIINMKEGKDESIKSLISACGSEEQSYPGVPDWKFQALLLRCAVEDQKRFHKDLKQLVVKSRQGINIPERH